MKLSLVLLTLNERTGLQSLFDRIPLSACDEILAIDGGSTDGTREFLESRNCPVHIQTRRGRGEAFRLAFDKAQGDALLFFSPDGNENPDDILKFRPLLTQGFDMVVASRMMRNARNEEDGQLFRWRKWANQTFNIMANLVWNRGPFVTDSINGFRAITRRAWDRMQPDESGYAIEYQSTIRAFKTGLRIAEFPTREGPRLDGREGSPSLKTGVNFLKLFGKELGAGTRSGG